MAPPRSSSSSSSSTSTEPLVRKAVLIETLGASFVQGQQCLGGPRRDTALFKEQQLQRLSMAKSLLNSASASSTKVVRPSLLTSPGAAAAFAVGALTALASSALPETGGATSAFRVRGTVSRALEGAVSDSFNDSLSALHLAKTKAKTKGENEGSGDGDERLRAVLRELRDARRAPDYGGGFAASASSSSSSWEGEGGEKSARAKSFDEGVDAAVSAAEAAIRAAAGLVFRASEKL